MGIFKTWRNNHAPGITVTGVVSAGLLDVNSTVAFGAGVSISGDLSGNTGFRGIASIASGDATVTISATAIASGFPVHLFAQSSFGQIIPSSVVDNVSFMAEAVDGATETGPTIVSYIIIA
jgi:hypothetical protein